MAAEFDLGGSHVRVCDTDPCSTCVADHTEEQQEALRIMFTNTHDASRVWDWPGQINELWACFSKHRPLVLQDLRDSTQHSASKKSKKSTHKKATTRNLLAVEEHDETEEEG